MQFQLLIRYQSILAEFLSRYLHLKLIARLVGGALEIQGNAGVVKSEAIRCKEVRLADLHSRRKVGDEKSTYRHWVLSFQSKDKAGIGVVSSI